MLKPVLLSFIVLASLVWLGYVGFDILKQKSNYSPTSLFCAHDEEILIVNRPKEVDFGEIDAIKSAPSFNFFIELNRDIYERGFFSAKRSHILLQRSINWTEKDIKLLFNKASSSPVFESGEFKVGNYTGQFYRKNVYLRKGEILKEKPRYDKFIYDKKASAAIIKFKEDSEVLSVSDIYFQSDGRVDYITYNKNLKQGKQVKDEVLFSGIVTKKFSSYHFFERDYYATLDSVYVSGPMSKWILNGFIELEYEGEKVIITDYIDGQDPILILNDVQHTLDEFEFSNRLTNNFPTEGNSYFIKYLEDLVVLSESEVACDKIIADFKLGNTIALDYGTRNRLYGSLPNSVSERFISNKSSYSMAVYRGKLLESRVDAASIQTTTDKKEAFAFNCGFDVQDFAVLNEDKNFVVLGKKGELKCVANGKLQWTKKLNTSVKGKIQLIDLHQSGEQFILLNTSNKIHLWNLSGNYVNGFPINLNTSASNEVKFYHWNGRSYFIIANEKNQVLHFDAKGRELNIISSEINITRKIDVWTSRSELYAGFANGSSFIMYNLERYAKHREFQLHAPCLSAKIPNELLQFGIKNGKLIKITQKGIKTDYQSFDRAKILSISNTNKNPTIIVQSANEIHLLNSDGIPFGQINLPFNEVEDVYLETSNSGKTLIAIIDGLQNNVYLYRPNGEQFLQKPLEGQTKVVVRSYGFENTVTTVVDQFIVQYFE
jgi:hypothetical protein